MTDAPEPGGPPRTRTPNSGRFLRLVGNELVVEALEFETDDPALGGEMALTRLAALVEAGPRADR